MLDAQAAAKRDPCPLLAKIAKVPLSNADAPLFQLLYKNDLGLPIDFSWRQAGSVHRYPFFSPKKQVEVLSEHGYFHRVLGLPIHLASEALDVFWQKFRALHPRHQVFDTSRNLNFQKLIPYYLHGDGGRGFKKDPIEILSMFPALGTGSNKRRVDLSSKRPLESEIELGINLQGHSGATRFLFTVLSSLVAKKDGGVFDDLMVIWGEELRSLLEDGFEAAGSNWRIIIIGFTGDSPFVKKVAKLVRSFHNVAKRHTTQQKKQKGCCWLCHAGFEDPEQGTRIPFEHLGFTEPEWLKTGHLNNPLPWLGDGGALLKYMLLDLGETPAAFFRADFFHVWHAGVGLDFTSSAFIYAMKVLFGQPSVAKNLDCLNEALKNWMRATREKLHCGHLTEDLLGYNGTREYPEGKWSKNMDTAVFMKFLTFLLDRRDFGAKVEADEILTEISATAKAMNVAIKTCLEAEYFMSKSHTEIVMESGHRFLTGYAMLVSMCHRKSLCLFKLRPKLRYLNHMFHRVFEEWQTRGFAVNPLSEATFASEDFVGRTARVSRRVNTRAVAVKTLQRYIFFMHTALKHETFQMLDFSML